MSETITKLGKERLEKLIGFIENLPDEKFEFDEWVTGFDTKNGCGTVCCAFGWTPSVFPESWEWRHDDYHDKDYPELKTMPIATGRLPEYGDYRHEFFGVSKKTFGRIFELECLEENTTRLEWLDHARKILADLEVTP